MGSSAAGSISTRSRPVRLGDEKDRVLLAGFAAGGEPAPGPPHRRSDRAGRRQLVQRRGQSLASGEGVEVGASEHVLGGRPRAGARVVGVLEPAVGVGDGVPVQVVDDVQALGPGVGGSDGHVQRG